MSILRRFYEKPRSFAAREWLFQIHLYAGLVIAIYAIVIGVTGSALIFAPEIREWQVREFLTVPDTGTRVSIDRVVESIEAAYPGAKLGSFGLPYEPNSTFRVSIQVGGKRSTIYVHPFTAAIIGQREAPVGKDVIAWIDDLHINLLTGPTGQIVNGVGALSLILLCLTGIVIWWPGKKYWGRAVSINWSARWKRLNYDLHSAVGFYTLLFTLMFSVSGVYFIWPEQSKNLVSIFSAIRPTGTANLSEPSQGKQLPLSQLLNIASNAVPGSWLEYVGMPNNPRKALRVALMGGGPRDYQTISNVDMDPVTGKIVKLQRADQRTAGEGFLEWLNVLHFGNFGLAMKILWVVMGLAPALLAVTGVLMWWNRVLSKTLSRSRRRREPAAVPEEVSESV